MAGRARGVRPDPAWSRPDRPCGGGPFLQPAEPRELRREHSGPEAVVRTGGLRAPAVRAVKRLLPGAASA